MDLYLVLIVIAIETKTIVLTSMHYVKNKINLLQVLTQLLCFQSCEKTIIR